MLQNREQDLVPVEPSTGSGHWDRKWKCADLVNQITKAPGIKRKYIYWQIELQC